MNGSVVRTDEGVRYDCKRKLNVVPAFRTGVALVCGTVIVSVNVVLLYNNVGCGVNEVLKFVTLTTDETGNCMVIISHRIVSTSRKLKSVVTSVLITKELKVVIEKLTFFGVKPLITDDELSIEYPFCVVVTSIESIC